MAVLLAACGPADLEVVEKDLSDHDSDKELTDTTIGFIETSGCDWNVGANACDFQLLDQDEGYWRLSEQTGDLILLDLSVMWCGPCNIAASTVQETQERYEEQGFQYVTILIADTQNDTVEEVDIDMWTSTYLITTAPVLKGDRNLLQSTGNSYGFPVSSWPTFILIDRAGNVIYGLRGYDESLIMQKIEANL